MDSHTPRHPHDLTLDWLNTNLVDGPFSGTSIKEFTLQPIGENVGFLGDLFRIIPGYSKDNGQAPESFVIKFPTDSDFGRDTGNALLAFEREAMFYRHCANTCPANPPQHFYSDHTGRGEEYLVIMEDLNHARFVDQVSGISQEDAMASVDSLAQLHSHYWGKAHDQSWLRGYDEWADVYPPQIDSGWPLYQQNFGYVIPDDLMALFPRANELFPAIVRHFHQNRPVTLIHGDARMENLAFEETGQGERVRIYDWQLVSTGPAVYDLVYFCCSSINPDDWDSYGMDLINRYYDQLVAHGVTDYSHEDLTKDMGLVACLLFGFASMIGNLLQPDEAGKAVIEATAPRFWTVMRDLDVASALANFKD